MNVHSRLLATALIASSMLVCSTATAQDPAGRPRLDRSRLVRAKPEVIAAWQKRQAAIESFRFQWTEQQTHPRGWLPNPRYPEREWLSIPALLIDRSYTVRKTLAVKGGMMRYGFDLDRKAEPVSKMLADGSRKVASVAKVTSYGINEVMGDEEFK